ncbi:hypothetical protein KKF91_17220 [Myxococcota bacterium]|nr:hypothetical protein [Myxococcota bacterium]MBU1432281.1 hypothetical protein [Myxococcota bacterium]MBU1897015.1 hypothetical protein [Myxococcota bacterium]
MSRKRKRARASDIAPKSTFNFGNFLILIAVLTALLLYRHVAGERTADFIQRMAGDEALPKASVLDRLDGGPDAARPQP